MKLNNFDPIDFPVRWIIDFTEELTPEELSEGIDPMCYEFVICLPGHALQRAEERMVPIQEVYDIMCEKAPMFTYKKNGEDFLVHGSNFTVRIPCVMVLQDGKNYILVKSVVANPYVDQNGMVRRTRLSEYSIKKDEV